MRLIQTKGARALHTNKHNKKGKKNENQIINFSSNRGTRI